MRRFSICLILFTLLTTSDVLAEQRFRVAFLQDGPVDHELIPLDLLEREIELLLGRDTDVSFLARESGDWTLAGNKRLLKEVLARPDVDAVVTMGLLGSAAAAVTDLNKPVVSMLVGDVESQNFPKTPDGVSGKRHFAYIDDSLSMAAELADFHAVTSFQHVAIFADEAWLNEFPSLAELARQEAARLGVDVTIIPVVGSADDAVRKMPPEADAAYITWLLRLSPDQMRTLTDLMVQRRVLSFSSSGRVDVEAGVLMTASADADIESLARRVAIVLQRIALGTPAETIRVDFQRPSRLAFNLATAKAVGFAPAWRFLEEADLYETSVTDGVPFSFLDALNAAIEQNRELAVSRFETSLARADVRSARAPLLPQLTLGAGSSRVKSSTARVFELAQDSTDADLTASQLIYSERAYADFTIAKNISRVADYLVASETLDTIETAAVAYFDLLRAYALRGVQRRNLSLSRENLRLAEVRLRVGHSSRSDVLRWESRVAAERADVYQAQALFEQTQTQLAQTINRRFDEPVTPEVDNVGPILQFISGDNVQRYVSDPLNWQILQSFYRNQALENSPELKAVDAEIAGLKREQRASRREHFLPEIELTGTFARNISRSGPGADFLDANLDDDQWVVGIRATLPLVTGGARRAQLSRARLELEQAQARRFALQELLESSATAASQRVGGSFPAIDLAREAAVNARAHLEMVQDQYAKGAVNVTALIDAQDASLDAELAEAEARFAFLIDLAQLFRAAGDFSLFFETDAQATWLQRINDFYANPKTQPEHR